MAKKNPQLQHRVAPDVKDAFEAAVAMLKEKGVLVDAGEALAATAFFFSRLDTESQKGVLAVLRNRDLGEPEAVAAAVRKARLSVHQPGGAASHQKKRGAG